MHSTFQQQIRKAAKTLIVHVTKSLLFLCLALFLSSCVEVMQRITINRDGSGEATTRIIVDKQWASIFSQ
jgi:starvation-inducible outer membrane lipoprotein